MITTIYQLNEQQLKDLEQLKALCKKVDGSIPNLFTHILVQRRTLPASVMFYEQGQLIGFLSVFFFYDDAVEIAMLVHPLARRKGIARQMMHNVISLIQTHSFSTLIFSSPSSLNNHWLPALGFSYQHSEFYMERDDLNPLLDSNKTLTFREANIKDLPTLCALDDACFPKKDSKPVERFQQLLDDRNYQIFIALLNNQPVGKAHLRWESNGATISDITILPTLQGKGLGTELITFCINFALSEGKPHLNLDVETHNQRALNLYTRLGFMVQNACDYWAIGINQIQSSFLAK